MYTTDFLTQYQLLSNSGEIQSLDTKESFETIRNHVSRQIQHLSTNGDVTPTELNNRIEQIATYLQKVVRVEPNEIVGIYLEEEIDQLIAMLGVFDINAQYILLKNEYGRYKNLELVSKNKVKVIIGTKKYVEELNKILWVSSSIKHFLCVDSYNIYEESETKNALGERGLWEYIAQSSIDEITAGGWMSSYTGLPMSKAEMDEYANNISEKLTPHLRSDSLVLEIGCASGITLSCLAPKVKFYYGTDISKITLQKNLERIKTLKANVKLKRIPAIAIGQLEEKDFDIVLINSVIQCFHGHNYLRKVIKEAIKLMKNRGVIFLGDIMDQDLKTEMIRDLTQYSEKNTETSFRAKTDWNEELFLSRHFLIDLANEIAEIASIEFSEKIFTIENELTKYRYDALLKINKDASSREGKTNRRNKYLHDLRTLERVWDVKR